MARRKSGFDVELLQARCRAFAGAEERLYKPPSNVLLYSVGGKTFAYFKTSEPERWRFSLRVTPDRFVELTDMPGVKPARYMGRFHWVTIVDVTRFPSAYLEELLDWSYQAALAKLTRKARAAITQPDALGT